MKTTKKFQELTNEQLDQVTGGGGGPAPAANGPTDPVTGLVGGVLGTTSDLLSKTNVQVEACAGVDINL